MTARVAGRRRLSATRRARTEHWPGGRANARNCDGPMSAGGTMTAPSCRVHGWAGCWQAAPVDPARLQSIVAQRMRQCSQQRWFQRGGASFGRCVQAAGDAQAKRTVAARACQQPGVRALRASARAFAPMLATALVSASRWWILSEAREASDGVAMALAGPLAAVAVLGDCVGSKR